MSCQQYARSFTGVPSQVAYARHSVASFLTGFPAADDVVVILSELASNAILYSRSGGRSFTVRAEMHHDHGRVEVEDMGGPWTAGHHDDGRLHGLGLIEALAGPGNWGVEVHGDSRVVWARVPSSGASLRAVPAGAGAEAG